LRSREEIEELELNMLLNAVHKVYNYDFSNYSQAHIRRRVDHFLKSRKLKNISEVQGLVLHNKAAFEELLNEFSIRVTEMFRDPGFFWSLRENVIPVLKTYPFPKIWIAGCATGEEVYSIAILLKEEGLYDRVQIFATDYNAQAVDAAKKGIYSINRIKEYTVNYQKSGGKSTFSDYYTAFNDFVELDKSLKKNIEFRLHNLDKDGVFASVNLLICRNVMIYFNKDLQNKVVGLFTNSLVTGGFLALGMKESLLFSKDKDSYEVIDDKHKIFKKRIK
jgi:chemotaxis protein methyltransferase CheR